MVLVVDDGPDYVRPVDALATAAKAVCRSCKVVVELEGLAVLQSHSAVESPAVSQALPPTAHLGQVIREDPGEAVGHVEVGGAAFELGPGAVVWLGRIGLKVLSIARIVERFGPHVVHNGRNSVPSVHPQAGLQ